MAKAASSPAQPSSSSKATVIMPPEVMDIIASYIPHSIYIVTNTYLNAHRNYGKTQVQNVGAFSTLDTANAAARKYHGLKVEGMARTRIEQITVQATIGYKDYCLNKDLDWGWRTEEIVADDDGSIKIVNDGGGGVCTTQVEVHPLRKEIDTWRREDMKPITHSYGWSHENGVCRCCNEIEETGPRDNWVKLAYGDCVRPPSP